MRVNPQGDAVMAGRGAPGAEVSIVWGGNEIGRVRADEQGAWVFVPSTPLSPGGQELTLSEHDQAGRDIKGDGPVSLVVPEATQMTSGRCATDRPDRGAVYAQYGAGDVAGSARRWTARRRTFFGGVAQDGCRRSAVTRGSGRSCPATHST